MQERSSRKYGFKEAIQDQAKRSLVVAKLVI